MNILLIGECYSKNLGDGVICETVEKVIKNKIKNVNVYKLDLSGWINYSHSTIRYEKNNKILNEIIKMRIFDNHRNAIYRSDAVLENLNEYNNIKFDAAIFAGGQMFMDYFSIPIYRLVRELDKKSIPVFFNACGIGRNPSRINRFLLKKTINKNIVKYISLRDNIKDFKEIYLERTDIDIHEVLDPALSLVKYTDVKYSKSNKIGLGVISESSIKSNGIKITYEKYLILLAKIIRLLDKKQIEWEIFTNGATEDYKVVEAIIEILGYDSNKYIVPNPTTPDELITLISRYKGIISFRLHSHIIATSLNIPVIGFIWDKKVEEFGKKMNCNENFIRLDEENIDNLISEKIDELVNRKIDNEKFIDQSEKDTIRTINEILRITNKENYKYE